MVGHLALSNESVHVKPEAVHKVTCHGHPNGQTFRVAAARSSAFGGAMQGARAEPRSSGIEEVEDGDRTNTGNDLKERRAAIWIGVPVLHRGTMVETPTHKRFTVADQLQETLARPYTAIRLAPIDIPAMIDEDLKQLDQWRSCYCAWGQRVW